MNKIPLLYQVNIILSMFIFLIFLIFTWHSKKTLLTNKLLYIILFSFFYTYFIFALVQTRLITYVPHLGRTGTIGTYLLHSMAYVYVRKILTQERWKWRDNLHFLPAIIYIIDMIPFFLKTGNEKNEIMQNLLSTHRIMAYAEGWFLPTGFHITGRSLIFLIYIIAQITIISKYYLEQTDTRFIKENKKLLYWLSILTLILLFDLMIPLGRNLFNLQYEVYYMTGINALVSNLIFIFFMVSSPEILYGMKGVWAVPPPMPASTEEIGSQQSAKSQNYIYLSEEQVTEIASTLERHFELTKAFLNPDYKLSNLASDTKIPSYHISAYLNRHEHTGYNDYINGMRIKDLEQLLRDDPSLKQFTIEAIGKMIGFNNRFTFSTAIKKATGLLPKEYIRKL